MSGKIQMYIEKSTVMKTVQLWKLIIKMYLLTKWKEIKKNKASKPYCRMKLNIYVVFLKIFQKQEYNK